MQGTGTLLRCEECGVDSDLFATGWRGYLLFGVEGESDEVLMLCPACAEREFEPSSWDDE